MNRQTSPKRAERDADLLQRIQSLKEEHPFWGYRRIWAHLKYADGMNANKKRIFRLMRLNELTVTPERRLKAKRTATRSKPRPTRPNEWWGIDMTKVMVESYGWIYITIVLDWHTKKIVGHYAGVQCKAEHWLEALNMGINQQFPGGVQGQGLKLMSDNGSQPTSVMFMRECGILEIDQAFTSYNNPKGNADTERMIRTMKEECLWLREWKSPGELIERLGEWIEKYNEGYLHSALGYKSPAVYEREWNHGPDTLLSAA